LIICGGKGWLYEKIYRQIGESRFREDIILIGDADNGLLASLYANATLFIMPSLYEGFGLPVVEAMSFGLPVVCADNSSLSEIAKGSTLLADAYNPEDIFRKIERILEDGDLRSELSRKALQRAKDFSWDKAAKETLEVIRSVK
jgi:glycosyltransferase involved in cell wall biosynthesis